MDAADPERRTFEYIGHVDVRPGGRGVLLLDLPHESNFGMIQLDPQHGYYRAVLRFVPIPPVNPRLHLPEPSDSGLAKVWFNSSIYGPGFRTMKRDANAALTGEQPCLAVASTLIGYARVSTVEQDTRTQLAALKAAGVSRVFQEKGSGADPRRPELARLLEQLLPGDVVAVYKLDRLARSLADLLDILSRIDAAGAQFRSLTEPIDTTTLAGRMLMQMLGAFAEFERGIIRERTVAGQRAAMNRGVHCGRRPHMTAAQAAKAAEQYRSGKTTLTALARLYGCHMSSVKRAIARVEGEAKWVQ